MKYITAFPSGIGTLWAAEEDGFLIGFGVHRKKSVWDSSAPSAASPKTEASPGEVISEFISRDGFVAEETPLLQNVRRQIMEYLEGGRRVFDVPLKTCGTPFQERIWKMLQEIPYGETRTYGQLAAAAGSPRGARAAGMACNRNPIMLLIPCHRVLGSTGSLTGFGGGIDIKEQLLLLEGAAFREEPKKI